MVVAPALSIPTSPDIATGLKLVPTYAYCRLYKNGNILRRHKDRPSCEISTTIHLGGTPWPIFMDDTEVLLEVVDQS